MSEEFILSANFYFPGVIIIIFLSLQRVEAVFLHKLVPEADQGNIQWLMTYQRIPQERLLCPPEQQGNIHILFPNTCVMTRKASDPRYLKEGCRCAAVKGRCCTKCHCLQLKTGYMIHRQSNPAEVENLTVNMQYLQYVCLTWYIYNNNNRKKICWLECKCKKGKNIWKCSAIKIVVGEKQNKFLLLVFCNTHNFL